MAQLNKFLDAIITEIVNPFILLLMGVAAVYFLWGVVETIMYAGDPAKREQGRSHMIWGIVGLVIMVGVYGILNILLNTFGIDLPPETGF